MNAYLGIDLGSVTTKVVALDADNRILDSQYIRTQGRPIEAVQQGYNTAGVEEDHAHRPKPVRCCLFDPRSTTPDWNWPWPTIERRCRPR